jgi:two-component sensor histidine kinase
MPPDESEQPNATLDRVLVLAPYRKDADYVRKLLADSDIPVEVGRDDASLAEALGDPPGVLAATQEALTGPTIDIVATHLRDQPPWSELPIVILLDQRAQRVRLADALQKTWPRSRLLFYQRPVATLELVSGIQSALLTRLRQRDVRDHIDREIELRHELNHRVKNILASVFSVFQMTRRRSETMDDLIGDFEGRLESLARVHAAVFSAGGEAISIGEVAALTFAPYVRNGDGRIVWTGPDLTVSRDAASTLALCLHELATNAIKYGALSGARGKVDLNWHLSDGAEPSLTISWVESGGPSVVAPARAGSGTRYIRMALATLMGAPPEIRFDDAGLSCRVSGRFARIRDGRKT